MRFKPICRHTIQHNNNEQNNKIEELVNENKIKKEYVQLIKNILRKMMK